MKKYLFIFKSEIMSNIGYILNIVSGFIGYFLMIFIFLNLWKYIYSDPNEIINGYTMKQMIWYVTITEILWGTIAGRKYSKKISQDVKSGNIAYNINKPYNYILYCLSSHLGDCFIRFVIYIVLGISTGLLFLHSIPSLNILQILAILITSILAIVISTLLITFIGLFSFIIEDSSPFYWVYSKIILVLGTLFPVEYFPIWAQKILVFSPVFVICYGPAKLFVDFKWNSFIYIIIVQMIYVLFSYFICSLLYKKGVKKLNVNGG